jgi:hypothetical protein
MRHLSRQPATDAPLHFFVLKHTDVVLALGGASVAIWQLAKHKPRHQTTDAPSNGSDASTMGTSLIVGVVHELRQVFTSLLVGLGLIRRRANAGNTAAVLDLVKRLNEVVRRGIGAVDVLESADSTNGYEREYGA